MFRQLSSLSFFFFNDTATTEIYTLSLHDALPISASRPRPPRCWRPGWAGETLQRAVLFSADRKSTRLNSSHLVISYAVFCLKKKNHRHNDVAAALACDDSCVPVINPAFQAQRYPA